MAVDKGKIYVALTSQRVPKPTGNHVTDSHFRAVANDLQILGQEAENIRFDVIFDDTVVCGQPVNVRDVAGILTGRLADASAIGTKYFGFLINKNVVPGDTGTVQIYGRNIYLVGLTIGADYFLDNSVPGEYVTPAPGAPVVQYIGFALDANTLLCLPNMNP